MLLSLEKQTSSHSRSLCTQAQGAELQDEPAPDPPTWVPSYQQDPGRHRISGDALKYNDVLRQRPENTWKRREAAPAPWEAAEGSPNPAGPGCANKRPQAPQAPPLPPEGPLPPQGPQADGEDARWELAAPLSGAAVCARAHTRTHTHAHTCTHTPTLNVFGNRFPIFVSRIRAVCFNTGAELPVGLGSRGSPLVRGGLATAPGRGRLAFCANTRSLNSFPKGKLFSFRCQCATGRVAPVGWRQEGPPRASVPQTPGLALPLHQEGAPQHPTCRPLLPVTCCPIAAGTRGPCCVPRWWRERTDTQGSARVRRLRSGRSLQQGLRLPSLLRSCNPQSTREPRSDPPPGAVCPRPPAAGEAC